jgi:hypothetical protein
MASDYTPNPFTSFFSGTLELMTGGDRPLAQVFRVPLERLLDNDAFMHRALLAQASGVALGMRQLDASDSAARVFALGSVGAPTTLLFFVFDGSDSKALSFKPAEGIAALVGSKASQNFKGVAADSHSLSGRIAAVTNSTSPLHFSDDQGATWTSVATANAFASNNNAEDIGHGTIWGALVNGVTNAIFSSATASASSWTSRSLNGTAGDIPLRIIGSHTTGRALVLGRNAGGSAPCMSESADGITWTSVTLPVAANDIGGSLAWGPPLNLTGEAAADVSLAGFFYWLAKTTTGSKLYRSPASGTVTWTLVHNSPRGELEVTADNVTGLVYIAGPAGGGVGRIGVSYDLGETFFKLNSGIESVAARCGVVFGLDASADVLYVSNTGLVSQQ